MKFQEKYTVNAPAERVASLLVSQELMDKRMAEAGLSDYSVESTEDSIIVHLAVPLDKLPNMVGKLLGDETRIDVPFQRNGLQVKGDIDPPKLPGQAHIIMDVTALSDTESQVDVSGDVKVNIPLLGKKIEQTIARYVGKVIDMDADLLRSLV